MFRKILIITATAFALSACGTINTDEWSTGAKTFVGGVSGGAIGAIVGGLPGMFVGAGVGGVLGCCVVDIQTKDDAKTESK